MNRKTRIGIAQTVGGETDQISGPAADQARAPAVRVVPDGKAGEVDRESTEGNAAYGVRVTTPDGSAVNVHLDNAHHVPSTQPAGQDTDGDEG